MPYLGIYSHVHNFYDDFIRACVYLKILNGLFKNTIRKRLYLYGIHLLSDFVKGTQLSTTSIITLQTLTFTMLHANYTTINLEKNKRTTMLNYIVHSLILEFEKTHLGCCHLKTRVRDVAYTVNVTIIIHVQSTTIILFAVILSFI